MSGGPQNDYLMMGGHWPVDSPKSETKKWKLSDTNYERFSDLLKAGEAEGHVTIGKVKDTLQLVSSKYLVACTPSPFLCGTNSHQL